MRPRTVILLFRKQPDSNEGKYVRANVPPALRDQRYSTSTDVMSNCNKLVADFNHLNALFA
jgi:hypothetical protein